MSMLSKGSRAASVAAEPSPTRHGGQILCRTIEMGRSPTESQGSQVRIRSAGQGRSPCPVSSDVFEGNAEQAADGPARPVSSRGAYFRLARALAVNAPGCHAISETVRSDDVTSLIDEEARAINGRCTWGRARSPFRKVRQGDHGASRANVAGGVCGPSRPGRRTVVGVGRDGRRAHGGLLAIDL
jgi:hypothetical protein